MARRSRHHRPDEVPGARDVIANHDSVITASVRPHVTIRNKTTNTIYEGGAKASRLIVPVIPR